MRANNTSRVAAGIALVALACNAGCDDDGLGGLLGIQVGIVNPRAGDVYDAGSWVSVAWIGIWSQQVYLEFSPDGGFTWFPLNGGAPIDRYADQFPWPWATPLLDSTQCRLKITPSGDYRSYETGTFTIELSGATLTPLDSSVAGPSVVFDAGIARGDRD
jgi:hypothetical protein